MKDVPKKRQKIKIQPKKRTRENVSPRYRTMLQCCIHILYVFQGVQYFERRRSRSMPVGFLLLSKRNNNTNKSQAQIPDLSAHHPLPSRPFRLEESLR